MAQTHSLLRIEEDPVNKGYDIESAGSPKDLLTLWIMLTISVANRLNVPKECMAQLLNELPPGFAQECQGNRAWCIRMPMPPKKKGGPN